MRRKSNKLAAAAVAAVASVAGAQVVQAQFVWDGDDGSNPNWSHGLNWVGNTAPSSPTDQIVFDDGGVGHPNSTVDAALGSHTFRSLTFEQNNAGDVYNLTIAPGTILNLTGDRPPGLPVPGLTVMPSQQSTPTTGTVATLIITGERLITSTGVVVSGRPTDQANSDAGALESRGILDLTGLNSFVYARVIPPQMGVGEANFEVGRGNTSPGSISTDKGPYSGKVILSDNSYIKSNRLFVGANSDGTAGDPRSVPVSELILGQSNHFNSGFTTDADGNEMNMNLPGNFWVGASPNSRGAAGVAKFREGLVNPVLNVGSLIQSIDFGNDPNSRNGMLIGSNQSQGHFTLGSRAFGVLDLTSASGGSEGEFNGYFQGAVFIGRGSPNVNGAAGMMSIGKGVWDSDNALSMGRTTNALNAEPIVGVLNVGVKGSATDTGGGTVKLFHPDFVRPLIVGQRVNASEDLSIAMVNLANDGLIDVGQVFVGENNQADNENGGVVSIVNLGGGTLLTGQIMGGREVMVAEPGEPPERVINDVGTNNTRLVNFHGGTLKAKALPLRSDGTNIADNFMENLTGAYVYSGGGTIDTNDVDIVIDQPLLAPTGDGVSSITVTDGGSGYRAAPIVVISGGGGTGATAVARINSAGEVIGLDVTNPGTGYTSAPTIDLIAGGGTNYEASLVPFGGTAATVTASLAANASGGITKTGAGTLTLTGDSTFSGGMTVNTGTVVAGHGNALGSGVLTVNTGATVQAQADLAQPLTVGGVSTSGTGSLDLTNNTLIVTGGDPAAIRGLLATGFAGGSWNGPGINSSAVAGEAGRALGMGLDGSDVVVKPTWAGDASLDGAVTIADLGILAANWQGTNRFWFHGDFNYDGNVTIADLGILAANWQKGVGAGTATMSFEEAMAMFDVFNGVVVPEPGMMGMLGLGLLGLRRRRRN